jgi:hypothetical protein
MKKCFSTGTIVPVLFRNVRSTNRGSSERALGLLALMVVLSVGTGARAGSDSLSATYIPLTQGTTISLTQTGTLDWAKFGNGENDSTSFLVATKIGNPVISPVISPVGSAPSGSVNLIAFTGGNNLNFTWTNGNFGMYNGTGPVDTVVTETIVPAVNSYPPGLGASISASASSQMRELNVYVQGFDSNMVLTASLSDGQTTTTTIAPTINPPGDPTNFYALGDYQILYSGAGETLTISAVADGNPMGSQSAFPNAGIFAATASAVPEPSTTMLVGIGMIWPATGLALPFLRRRLANKRPIGKSERGVDGL